MIYVSAPGNELEQRYAALPVNSSGAVFLKALSRLPLYSQPGTEWNYSLGFTVLGLVIEAITKQRLGDYLEQQLFKPLGMDDTNFWIQQSKLARLAKSAQVTNSLIGEKRPEFESGGGGLFSTAMDYMSFSLMLLNNGKLDSTRILSRKTVEYMTSDHLGPEVDVDRLRNFAAAPINGYGFGLGVAVRKGYGVSGLMGSPGDYLWGGSYGTFFWISPKEDLAVVFLAMLPSVDRSHYRQVITSLVLQSIID